MQKVILITGTSTGVGQSLAVQLAKQNHKVYATMRNLNKKTALESALAQANTTATIKQLDVQNTESINACVQDIIKTEGRIDALINNAGAGFVRTTEQATLEEIQWVLDVNLMGVIRCTKAVLPFMREANNGRIINVSSVGGLVGQPFNEIYCAAKFAVEGYTESLASYVQPAFNIQFTSIEPGGISSEFATNALTQFQQNGGMKDDAYKPLLEAYIASANNRSNDGVYQTPDEVANIIINCLNNPNPPIRMRTSDWAEDFTQLKTQADPTGKKQQQIVMNLMS